MAGIYIHIPFCRKACHYCNFHFSTQTQLIEPFVHAVIKEIQLQKEYLQEPIETIYFGGGTPSLLPIAELQKILNQINLVFNIQSGAEITLEANPDDIEIEKAKQWKTIGINRLSIGIQSFQQSALTWMNRAHDTKQSHQAIEIAHQVGLTNLNVDLIYGTPHLTEEDLINDLNIISNYEIPHVSCYALTVEEKTALHKMIAEQKMENVNANHQSRHFEIVTDYLTKQGMEHYEISNFAQPGHRSRHNSNYWKGIPYLGLGPSAHSFNETSRQWNVANNNLYINSLDKGILAFEMENLPLTTRYNEYMMVSLRCMEGFELKKIEEKFGTDFLKHTHTIATEFVIKGQLEKTENGYTIHKDSRFLADGIASTFFWID
jgi:oxygen-independent coproporphyrinogen-3 oxidase